jgi:hypothetical protein
MKLPSSPQPAAAMGESGSSRCARGDPQMASF